MIGEALGKQMDVVNRDTTPFPFCHFPDARRIRIGQIDPAGYDAVILLECADVSRSGQERLGDCFKINIDHHYSNFTYADINWINPQASAVGEMVFELGERLGAPMAPGDRRAPLLRHRLRHRLVPVLQHDRPGLRDLPQARRASARARSASPRGSTTTTRRRRSCSWARSSSTLRMNAPGQHRRPSPCSGSTSPTSTSRRSTPRTSRPWPAPSRAWRWSCSSRRWTATCSGSASGPRARPTRPWSPSTSAAAATSTPPGSRPTGPYDRLIVEIPRTVEDLLRADPGRRPALLIPAGRLPLDGLIVVDKPRGPTSHDIVFRIRRLLGVKAGHCGTLDPEASGVLLVAVGRAARLFPFLSGHDKAYSGDHPFRLRDRHL